MVLPVVSQNAAVAALAPVQQLVRNVPQVAIVHQPIVLPVCFNEMFIDQTEFLRRKRLLSLMDPCRM
jgi:hypothetical protein